MKIYSSGGGGAGFKLAPDLNYISSNLTSRNPIKLITFDPSGGLTTALSLSGKFAIGGMSITGISAENFNIELSIDGEIIMNDSVIADTNGISIIGERQGNLESTSSGVGLPVICESSLVLKVQSTTDTSVTVQYIARPIL